MQRGLLIGISMLLAGSVAFAQEDEAAQSVTLEPIAVTARGFPRPVSQTPGGIGIIEAEILAETGPVSLTDAAIRLPGVDKTSESVWGGDISIRGLGRDNVVFLIDGVRVNVTTDINGRFGLVNPKDIQRIEILKGPISTLYGSGSTGGVVNIITKKGRFEDIPAWLSETSLGGSSNPAGGGVHQMVSYNAPNTWILGSLGYRTFADFTDGAGDEVDNSSFRDLSGTLAAGFKWNAQNTTHIAYQHMAGSDIGIPGTGMAPLPVNADVTLAHNDRHFLVLSHSFKPAEPLFKESNLHVSYQTIERRVRIDNFTSGPLAQVKPSADHVTVAGTWKNSIEFEDHSVVAGVDAWNWHMESWRERTTVKGTSQFDLPTPETDQTSLGVFIEDDWRLSDDWTLNLGGRADYVRVSNEATTSVDKNNADDVNWGGHMGATWQVAPEWSMTTMVSSGYRAPNILERFKNINLGGGVVEKGNPNLDPERSLFFEYGIHHTGRSVRSSAAAFYNKIYDYIIPERVEPTLFRMDNVSEATVYGAELSVQWDPAPTWTIFGNIAYTQGRDESSDDWLRFIAPFNGLCGVTQKLDQGIWWTVEAQWAAQQNHVPQDVEEADAWIVLNARTGYNFTLAGMQHAVVLGANNIFNQTYSNYLATSRGAELREPGLGIDLNWRIQL